MKRWLHETPGLSKQRLRMVSIEMSRPKLVKLSANPGLTNGKYQEVHVPDKAEQAIKHAIIRRLVLERDTLGFCASTAMPTKVSAEAGAIQGVPFH